MATIAEIREGLRVRLATIAGLNAYAYWPASPECPAAIVRPNSHDYHQTSGDSERMELQVTVLGGPVGQGIETAQAKLDAYLARTGALSVKAAIEAEPTLGGKADDLIVSGWRDYGGLVVSGIEYIGAKLDVTVIFS